MEEFFKPGIVFQSHRTYTAETDTYRIDPAAEDVAGLPGLIYEEAVPCPFVLRDLEDVTIDLGGARLLFNGKCLPFVLERCRNITLRNFTIDYRRAPFTQFDILEADEEHLVLKLCGGYPCIARNNELIPVDEDYEYDTHSGNMLLQPFDAITRAPAYHAGCMLAVIGESGSATKDPPMTIQRLRSELRPDGTLVWHGRFPTTWRRGQVLVVSHDRRSCPGIYAFDCENTLVEHVRMKRVSGFGIHGYFCRDFTVRDMVLKADDDSRELVSINADGVHQIGMSGKLIIEDCVFENMLDDGGNFHNYFIPVEKAEGDRVTAAFRFHGAATLMRHRIFRAGDRLTVYRKNSIVVKGCVEVESVRYDENSLCACITLKNSGGIVEAGDHLENTSAAPEIEIRRCRTGHNRPRGFLISTWRKCLIEGCHFTNSSCAVHFTGDTNYWHESGPVRDVTIRGNVFENCGYDGDTPAICSDPVFDPTPEAPYYHSGITVKDNLFISYQDTVMRLNYTDNVTFENNRFIHSDAYPYPGRQPRILTHCCGAVTEIGDTREP